MTSPALERMAARAKLPITVCGWPGYDIDGIPVEGDVWLIRTPNRIDTYAFDVYSAGQAYLALCASIESSPTTSDQR